MIENGFSATDGAGIQSFENLTLDGVTVQNNEVKGAGQDAGGIAQGGETKAGGNLTILNSTIRNNTASDDAGALDHYNSNDLIIRDTLIESNVSGDPTGLANEPGYVGPMRIIDAVTPALYADQSILFDNLTFQNNKVVIVAEDYLPVALGGILVSAQANQNWDMTVRNSTFSGNFHEVIDADPNDAYYGDGRGGALYITDVTTLTIEDTTFTENYSYGNGGAFQIANSDNTTNSVLNNITVTDNGDGAVHGFTGRTGGAGGLWIISFNTATTSNVTINDSSFTGNTATSAAGSKPSRAST